jgi:hypothetical protein
MTLSHQTFPQTSELTYERNERKEAEREACLMINILEEEREVMLEKTPFPPNEILELKRSKPQSRLK